MGGGRSGGRRLSPEKMMKLYSISQLARAFGLSRSTLLYYDRIGLLKAPQRTAAGYRQYTEREYCRLERICLFRGAGLPLADVQKLLSIDAAPSAKILEKRLRDLEDQVINLRGQQQIITSMLKTITGGSYAPILDKKMWVAILTAAGMGEAAMAKWHAEFESRAPQAHHDFLLSIGIPEDEARQIRAWSREIKTDA